MALEYFLAIQTSREPAEMLDLLIEVPGLTRTSNGLRGRGVDEVRAIPEHPVSQALMEKSVGFRPTLSVVFRVDKFEGMKEGVRTMVRCLSGLLRSEPGDA